MSTIINFILKGKIQNNNNNDDDYILPSSLDWAKVGKVTSVKDQGDCNCCWAFVLAGSIESQVFSFFKIFIIIIIFFYFFIIVHCR